MANSKRNSISFRSVISGFLTRTIRLNDAKLVSRTLFFLLTWFSLWFVYGNVLFQLQENSLWIFATPAEFELLQLPGDYLTYFSRFFLTLFAVKWLGSLFVALILSCIELLSSYIIKVKASLFFISYLPSVFLLLVIFSSEYSLYYEQENSTIIKILLLVFVSVAMLSLAACAIRGKINHKIQAPISLRTFCTNVICIMLSLGASLIYATRDSEFIRIAAIKYYASQQKWSKVARIAEESEKPTKSVAAYHAIALAQMGQIGERLFRITHDFEPVSENSTNLKKKFLDGGLMYAPYIYLHTGLTQTSYHYSMEEIVMSGTYKVHLKVMIQAAVINREKLVADKLLAILSLTPFEGDFVKKYRHFNEHPEDMDKDPILAPIIELKPDQDTFEQVFKTPLYISYYSMLSGGSDRALDLALTSCLYTKDLNGFSSRCGALIDRNILPKHFQEALVMMCQLSDPEALSHFKISRDIYNNVTDFYNELDNHNKDRDKGKAALKKKFGKTYMYYNTFENVSKK